VAAGGGARPPPPGMLVYFKYNIPAHLNVAEMSYRHSPPRFLYSPSHFRIGLAFQKHKQNGESTSLVYIHQNSNYNTKQINNIRTDVAKQLFSYRNYHDNKDIILYKQVSEKHRSLIINKKYGHEFCTYKGVCTQEI
jgi:hypothetical protein